MKYFKSLNCCLCDLPFAPIANQPRSPQKLECGLTMCHGCFEKEKALEKEERKHQCRFKGSVCFNNPNFAYFLIDLLSEDFTALMATKSGYVLSKPDPRIECPSCHEEYSLTKAEKSPFDLYCNHTICDGCFTTIKMSLSEEWWKYGVNCPTCQKATHTISSTMNNSLKEFLRELPEMIEQFEKSKLSTQKCSGCEILDHIESMFNCSKCNVKICGCCAFRHHREHNVEDLIAVEAIKILKEVTNTSETEIAECEKILSALHEQAKKIINDCKGIILNKGRNARQLMKIQEVFKQQQEIRQFNEEFMPISEAYRRQIGRFTTKMQDLLRRLEKDEKSKK